MDAGGGCLCGAVAFTAQAVDTHVHAGHCNLCHRRAGGPALAEVVASLAFQGAEHIGRYGSSGWAERDSCARCGSHLFHWLGEPDQYTLWMGAFGYPAPFAMAGEIFIEEKPAGYALAGDHRRLTGGAFLRSMQQSGGR